MVETIINPLKKEIEQSNSYKELLVLNEARLKKTMGVDADWLVTINDEPELKKWTDAFPEKDYPNGVDDVKSEIQDLCSFIEKWGERLAKQQNYIIEDEV